MMSGSSMHWMIRIVPPQAGQVSMSIPQTRFTRCAQVIVARRSAGVRSSGSALVAHPPPLPRLAGVARARYLFPGANTACVVPSRQGIFACLDVAFRRQRQALFREGRPANIPTQPLELLALIRPRSHTGVQGESRHLTDHFVRG